MMLSTRVLAATYRTTGVSFDGNDRLVRTAATGIANSKVGIFSAWLKCSESADGATIRVCRVGTSTGLTVTRLSTGLILIGGANGATTCLSMFTNGSYDSSDGWLHVLASWDVASSLAHLYVNGVDDRDPSVTFNNTNIAYADDIYIGATDATGNFQWRGDMADLYINVAEYLDLSVAANRAKFARGGRPVSLGADGSKPTGSQPAIFLKGPAASFATNLGTAGALSVTGTLTDAATPPQY